MKNLIGMSKYFFVVFFLFQKNTNAQIGLWNKIQEKSEDKINFILFIPISNTISKVPYYGFDNSTPISEDKLVYFQPGVNMDFCYRFGKKLEPKIWAGMNIETLVSIQMVSVKFCGVVGYKDNVAIYLYYNALTLKTNHHTDARSFSKNYESSNMPGASIEFSWERIYANILYQKSSKVEFFNYKITYDIVPDIFSAGFESKSIYGSGPIAEITFGKKIKQISVSWLTPKKFEKEIYEIRNGLYLKATFPIY